MNETNASPAGNMPAGSETDSALNAAQTSAVTEVPARSATDAEVRSVLAISDTMVVLTWLAFLIACIALYRIAWKPILRALERREGMIRKSLEDAEALKQKTAESEEERRRMMREASQEAAAIVDWARKAAEETAHTIELRAREQADALLKGAEQEIRIARDNALTALRREAAGLAIDLTERLIQKNLDASANRALTDQLIRELP